MIQKSDPVIAPPVGWSYHKPTLKYRDGLPVGNCGTLGNFMPEHIAIELGLERCKRCNWKV